MAGEVVETMGERFKRLQEAFWAAEGDDAERAAEARLHYMAISEAFAEYVLGLERDNKRLKQRDAVATGFEHLMEVTLDWADECDEGLSKTDAMIRVWEKQKQRADDLHSQLTAVQSERDEARQEVERLRAELFGPQKQPASVRQIEAQAKSAANQLADAFQAQSRDLTSKPHGAAGE